MTYVLCGSIILSAPPSFGVPVFNIATNNDLLLQCVDTDERIAAFSTLSESGFSNDSVSEIIGRPTTECHIGGNAIIVIHLENREFIIGSRTQISEHVPYIERLSTNNPFFLLQLFKFTRQKGRIRDAVLRASGRFKNEDLGLRWATAELRPPNRQDEAASERRRAIDNLIGATSFQHTHAGVARVLPHMDELDLTEAQDLVKAAVENTQIRWIVQDTDVYAFFSGIMERYGAFLPKALQEDVTNVLIPPTRQ